MNVHFSSKTPEWSTPQDIFDALNDEFSFTLDPASTDENAKCKKHYTLADDGLSQSWERERVFVNPPYGRVIGSWVQKMAEGGADVCVALLPARTDTRWFHKYILGRVEIRFVPGRIKFGGGTSSAPFPSMICVWGK